MSKKKKSDKGQKSKTDRIEGEDLTLIDDNPPEEKVLTNVRIIRYGIPHEYQIIRTKNDKYLFR